MVVFVSAPCSHHSPSSGYHQLVECFPGAPWIASIERGRIRWQREPAGAASGARSVAELDRLHRPIWHVLHADLASTVRDIRREAPRARIVATLHQPKWFVRELGFDQEANVADADVVVVVSRRQLPDLASLARRVVAVPHGVWPHAFHPDETPEVDPRSWLVVGEHLRDWGLIEQVCERTAAAGISWTFVVPRRASGALRIRGVTIESDVSERRLADLYHRAGGTLFALVDATANNALLEALSAGCPIVANDLRGAREYAAEAAEYYRTGDVAGCLRAIDRVATMDPARRRGRAAEQMARAQQYVWTGVARRFRSLFRALEAERARE